eukprot:scaffold7541_cov116-Isochrysis_galbana.AAC.1
MSISSYASDLSAASNSHSCEIIQSTPSRQSGMVQPVVNEMFATVHAAGSSLLGLYNSCSTFDSTWGSLATAGRATGASEPDNSGEGGAHSVRHTHAYGWEALSRSSRSAARRSRRAARAALESGSIPDDPRVSGAYSISSIQTVPHTKCSVTTLQRLWAPTGKVKEFSIAGGK